MDPIRGQVHPPTTQEPHVTEQPRRSRRSRVAPLSLQLSGHKNPLQLVTSPLNLSATFNPTSNSTNTNQQNKYHTAPVGTAGWIRDDIIANRGETPPRLRHCQPQIDTGLGPAVLSSDQLTSTGSFNSPFVGVRRCQTFNHLDDPAPSNRRVELLRIASDIRFNRKSKDFLNVASLALTRILRHTFHEEELIPHPGCFFEIDAVLNCRTMKKFDLNRTDLVSIVNSDGKGRFAVAYQSEDISLPGAGHLYVDISHLTTYNGDDLVQPRTSDLRWIRANQGHSKSLFGGDLIRQLNNNEPLLKSEDCLVHLHQHRYAFHGTSWSSLEKIFYSGYLCPMERLHVHFSKTLHKETVLSWTETNDLFPEDARLQHLERLSGLRRNADVAIVVDVQAYLERWPVQRRHSVASQEGILHPSGRDELSKNSSAGILQRLELNLDDLNPRVQSLTPCSDDSGSEESPCPILASSSQCFQWLDPTDPEYTSFDESYSMSANLNLDTDGHLKWEVSKNGVVLCSGWHTWPGGYAPPVPKGNRSSRMDLVEDSPYVFAPNHEGLPVHLFYGIIELSSGKLMTVQEATDRCRERLKSDLNK